MAVINISGGQINIAGGNSEINAVQVNTGRTVSDQTQVNAISGKGRIRTVQVNTDVKQYNNTTFESR